MSFIHGFLFVNMKVNITAHEIARHSRDSKASQMERSKTARKEQDDFNFDIQSVKLKKLI